MRVCLENEKSNPLSDSFKMSQHLWSAHLRSCSFSHHVMPAELISKFPDGSFFPHASSPRHCCALSQPGQQDLAPHGSLLLHQQSPSFSLSLSLPATWGNDSITYDLIHHLMMFGHSKAHLRPIKGSSHSLYSLFSASKTDPAGNVRVCFDQMRVCVCEQPLQLYPIFLLFWALDQFLVCLWAHVERVRRRRAMCQEKHMALLGCRHLPLDRWERLQNH